MTGRYCLSIHTGYACGHSGACCTAGWPISAGAPLVEAVHRQLVPVAGAAFETVPDADGGRSLILATTDDGACAFFEPRRGRLCAIHRTAGQALLPAACRNFPRISLRDPRGVFVTLSHYCPTAARLLLQDRELAIVEAPPSLTLDDEVEGLDATGVLPPLLRPGMLMSLDAYDTWEREAIATLNDRRLSAHEAVEIISAATASSSDWRPGLGELPETIAAAFAGARRRDRDSRPVAVLEHAVKSFLAAHAFASWAAYQHGGLGAVAAALRTALRQFDHTLAAARRADAGPEDAFITAVRQADLLLRHTRTHVGTGSLSPLRRD